MPRAKAKIKEPSCNDCFDILEGLKQNSQLVESSKADFKRCLDNIEEHTRSMADTLREFRIDQKEYVSLIAGKRQVPASIFTIIVLLLVTLLVASEVRYSKSDITIKPLEGITIKPAPGTK